MPNPTYLDASGLTRSIAGSGNAGNDGDPDLIKRAITSIPAGAAEDLVTIISKLDDTLTIVAARLIAPGQAAMSASSPVVVASNQTPVPISGAITIGVPTYMPDYFDVESTDLHSGAVDFSVAPTSGQKRVIDSLLISVDTAMTVTLSEESGSAILNLYMAANSSLHLKDLYRKLPTVNKKVQIITSIAGKISAHSWSHSEP